MAPLPHSDPPPNSGRSLAALTASNSLWNTAAFVVSLSVTFITTPLYLHRLGESSYGILVLIMSMLTPLSLLDMGIGPATIKYVAESESTANRPQSINYVRSTLLFNLIVGLSGAVFIAALAEVLAHSVFKIPAADQSIAQTALYWVALRWLALQVGNTFSSIPIALRRYKVYSIGAILASSSIDATGLVALYTGGNLAAITRAEAVTALIIIVMWILISRRLLPGISILPHWHRASFSKTFRFGFWQMVSNIGALFAHETERTLLGILTSTVAVGFYNVAWALHSAVYLLIAAFGQVLFPTFSHLYGQGRRNQASQIVVQAIWLLGVLAVGLYVPLFVFAKDILWLWVGADVAQAAAGVLRVIALAGMSASLFIVPSTLLMGVGQTRWLAWEAILQGGITVGISLILIPHFGLDGAAWGVLVSMLATVPFFYLTWKNYLRESVDGRSFFTRLLSILGSGVLISLIADACREIFYFAWTPTWVTLILSYGLFASGTILIVIVLDRILPGGYARWQSLQALIIRALPQLNQFRPKRVS